MAVLCTSLGVVCLFDYKKRKIPNLSVVLILVMGAVRSVFQNGLRGLGVYLFAAVSVLFLLYPLFRIGGLGAGDVKLLSACAGYFSPQRIFYFLFFSMLVSAIFSLIRLCRERDVRDRILYFCAYCTAVVRSGKWGLYLPQKGERKLSGVCMTGPVLCSVLLGIGGIY